MKPEFTSDPRADLETRVVALLLGEASPFEEAQLLQLIERDPELAAFYREMQKTVGLVQAVTQSNSARQPSPAQASAAPEKAPKLSATRRAALLAVLQTPPAEAAPASSTQTPSPKVVTARSDSPWHRCWQRLRQPVGPAWPPLVKLAAIVALLAILSSLMLPALSSSKRRAASITEKNRQKMAALETELAKQDLSEKAAEPENRLANGRREMRRSESFGVAVTPSPTPALQGQASARFAQQVFLPTTTADESKAGERGNRAVAASDKLAMVTDAASIHQGAQNRAYFFDANGTFGGGQGGAGAGLGREAHMLGEWASSSTPATRDAKQDTLTGLAAAPARRPAGPPSATPAPAPAEKPHGGIARLGLADNEGEIRIFTNDFATSGAGSPSLDTFQRQSLMAGDLPANLPQQNLAYGNVNPGRTTPETREQFWKDAPNLNIVVNTAPSAGRLDDAQVDAGTRLKDAGAVTISSAFESTRKRLAEPENVRELERLARQTVEMGQAAGAGNTMAAGAPPPPPPAPTRALEETTAAKKEVLLERLEAEKKPGSTVAAKAAATPLAPPPVEGDGDPALKTNRDDRRAGAALPPLIHQMEVQTAPHSVANFSTFSLNVSDVAFKTAAASLQAGQLPDPNSIRVEEFLNALNYRDPAPAPGSRLAFNWEIARHPFAHQRDLLRFSIQTAAVGRPAAQPLNLVVLLDNSGSMGRPDRVAIVSQALRVLANKLQPQDKLSVVAFARRAQLCVDGQSGQHAGEALQKVLQLNPEGGTDLGAGLDLAYQTALKHYQSTANNRVLLLTDGAANLGDVDPDALHEKVVKHRQKGVALDCFGVGWEGLADDLLEALSRNGDGRYALLNDVEQAATEFAEKLAGAFNVAAADVKTQVEFNPYRVTAYRQIGYARHQLTKEQFRDNTVDAAELAAAEAGNAMYVVQINPEGQGPLGVVRVRYRLPATGEYEEREWMLPYTPQPPPLAQASPAMRLAATAALFGEYLARNPYAGEIQLKSLAALAENAAKAFEPDPRPQQLVNMVQQALRLEGIP